MWLTDVIQFLLDYFKVNVQVKTPDPVQAPKQPVATSTPVIQSKPTMPPTSNQPELLLWDTPQHTYHAVRVTCDNAELSLGEKNLICACIYQESQFYNYEPLGIPTQFHNKDSKRNIWSTDWGLCQVNDYFHIGIGKDFPSVNYVMNNPGKVVQWMIKMYKNGQLRQWSSYSSGAYKKWLLPNSPMWALRSG